MDRSGPPDTNRQLDILSQDGPRDDVAIDSLSDLEEEVLEYAARARAKNTVRAYRADWEHFVAWCQQQRRSSLPAEPSTVALYLAAFAQRRRITTLARRLVTLTEIHRARSYDPPTRHIAVRSVWEGIKRTHGVAARAKRPTLIQDIRDMVAVLGNTPLGQRDKALLLVGFAGALRRSELVGLDVGHIQMTAQGMVLTVPFSKTDQEGRGRQVGIPFGNNLETCPVNAVSEWLKTGGITDGPVFRAVRANGSIARTRLVDRTVARVVKRTLLRLGRDPSHYAGHSLRAGLATQAAISGVSERVIQQQTGHRSLLILRRYIRSGELFRDNAAGKIGL
jgi:site-specific recombinase XerD